MVVRKSRRRTNLLAEDRLLEQNYTDADVMV